MDALIRVGTKLPSSRRAVERIGAREQLYV